MMTRETTPLRSARIAQALPGLLLAASLALTGCAPSETEPGPLPSDGAPGTFMLGLEHDGVEREALVYVPESYDGTRSTPLFMNFHGFGGYAEGHMEWADMRALSDTHGFVLTYPQGSEMDGSPHWNTSLPSADNKSSASDFGFIDDLIDTIAATYTLDPDRIYAAGYSNGGMFAFGLACHRPERIAAVVSVSGTMLDDVGVDCTPPPTSVMTLHGTEDSVVRYEGGDDFQSSALGVIDYWVDLNGITGDPVEATATVGSLQIDSLSYTGGTGGTEVQHYRVVGGDHVWFNFTVDGSSANTLIWDFVSRFGRDGAL